jgi:hypothetical protein
VGETVEGACGEEAECQLVVVAAGLPTLELLLSRALWARAAENEPPRPVCGGVGWTVEGSYQHQERIAQSTERGFQGCIVSKGWWHCQ